jgi:peroxiredoxin
MIVSVHSQSLEVGSKAPDFKLHALDGTITTLNDYQDKVIVIKMWFKECTPCLQEIPSVNSVVKSYSNRNDIVFLAPSPNSRTTLQKFAEKVDFNYEIMSGSYEMLKKYNSLKRYPSHAIIDKKGMISFFYEGNTKNIDKVLISEINKALKI